LYISPEVKVAMNKFFNASYEERVVYLHGVIDDADNSARITAISVPPQRCSGGSVEHPDSETDPRKFLIWNDKFLALHRTLPRIGLAHSFSGGAHHSGRDDNTDSLIATEGAKCGRKLFFSITTGNKGSTAASFRVDCVLSPHPSINIMFEGVEYYYWADADAVAKMLEGAEDMINKYIVPAATEKKPEGVGIQKLVPSGGVASQMEQDEQMWGI
jgi:hypothetical protein